jgi:hypothetical protein
MQRRLVRSAAKLLAEMRVSGWSSPSTRRRRARASSSRARAREVHPTTGRGSRPGILTCDDQRSAVARHDDLRAATPLLPDLSTGFLADLWVPEEPRPGEPAVDTPVAGCGVDQQDRAGRSSPIAGPGHAGLRAAPVRHVWAVVQPVYARWSVPTNSRTRRGHFHRHRDCQENGSGVLTASEDDDVVAIVRR